MPQLSLYLDDAAMDALKRRAAAEGVSLSRFARERICEEGISGWPAGYWNLYGSVEDGSFREPGELDLALDAPRAAL